MKQLFSIAYSFSSKVSTL